MEVNAGTAAGTTPTATNTSTPGAATTTAGQATGGTAAAGTTPTNTTPAAVGEEFKGMSREAFNQRLAEAQESARRSLLKDLGVEKPEDAKSAITKARELEQASLTETQRLQKQLEELTPKAKRATTLEERNAKFVSLLESEIPESKKGLLDLAPSDPDARAEWLLTARSKGHFKVDAPTATTTANPANTIGPAGPATPKPAGTLTPYEQWQAYVAAKQTIRAANFYDSNRRAIETSRPK
jgi:hypothetical protein